MNQPTNASVYEENVPPLRIYGEQENKHLSSPYELTSDDITLQFLQGNPQIAHFQAVSTDGKPGFKRHFLYSRANGHHLFTTSGYLFSGPVDVYSWKARESPGRIEPDELAEIEMLGLVDMVNISGDNENETGGLPDAVIEHMRRLDGLAIDPISLEEALKVYKAMIHHVPRF